MCSSVNKIKLGSSRVLGLEEKEERRRGGEKEKEEKEKERRRGGKCMNI